MHTYIHTYIRGFCSMTEAKTFLRQDVKFASGRLTCAREPTEDGNINKTFAATNHGVPLREWEQKPTCAAASSTRREVNLHCLAGEDQLITPNTYTQAAPRLHD
jgi:hypothetical protein